MIMAKAAKLPVGGLVTVGSKYWAPHREKAYVRALVEVVFDDGRVRVRVWDDGRRHSPEDEQPWECHSSTLLACPENMARSCVANMDELPELNMAEVLENVDMLYQRWQPALPGKGWSAIYSSVGPVLIAMNPFKELPLYGDEWTQAFRTAGQRGEIELAWQTLGPHCYWTVERAFQGLRAERQQSVVICGESGAGKTVTNRKMLEYLLDAESNFPSEREHAPNRSMQNAPLALGGTEAAPSQSNDQQKHRIAEANDLLEAFGNAKTLRNDNSSRFGKYSQLHFDPDTYRIIGFEIEHYLLERSRVVCEPQGERNYHIFYNLLRAELTDDCAEVALGSGPHEHAITRIGSNVVQADGTPFNDKDDFDELCTKMVGAGFKSEDRADVFRAVAAVVHLCDVQFEGARGGASESSRVVPSSEPSLQKASELLSTTGLAEALISLKATGKNGYTKNVNVATAKAQRDAVAKVLYSRIFDYLMDKINSELTYKQRNKCRATVGLLDIFGFEDMPLNGLEQLYINLTNERIQYLFNQVMFERELEAYKKEGIERAFERPSNWPCIELFISKSPVGIVGLLADQCRAGASDPDKAFLSMLSEQMANHSHFRLIEAKLMKPIMENKRLKWGSLAAPMEYWECFQIQHYAGGVVYTVRDFVEKSKDTLPQHLECILRSCKNRCVAVSETHAADSARKTIGEKFVKQLQLLSDRLDSGSNFFVRCIKPNPRALPGVVDRPFVLEQLINGGVVAALEMRKAGYPDRMEYREFCNVFWILENGWRSAAAPRKQCEDLLTSLIEDRTQYAFGFTKVFLRAGVLDQLRAALALRRARFAIVVQRRWRLLKGIELIRVAVQAKTALDQITNAAAQMRLSQCKDMLQVFDSTAHVGKVWEDLRDLQINSVSIPKLRQDIVCLAECSKKLAACKAHAETLFAQTLQEKRKQLSVLFAKVDVIDDGLSSSTRFTSPGDDAEKRTEEIRVACQEACSGAKAKLETIASIELYEIEERGPEVFDLSMHYSNVDLAPNATALLQHAVTFVEDAERRWKTFQGVRFCFDRRASGLQSQCSDARQSLKTLHEQAPEILEGTDGFNVQHLNGDPDDGSYCLVISLLNKASILDCNIDALYRAGSDIEAYEDSARVFLETVARAEAALAQAQSERAHKLREEERARRESFVNAMMSMQSFAELRKFGAHLLRVTQWSETELDGTCSKRSSAEEQDIHDKLLQLRKLMYDFGIAENDAPQTVDAAIAMKPDVADAAEQCMPQIDDVAVQCTIMVAPDVADAAEQCVPDVEDAAVQFVPELMCSSTEDEFHKFASIHVQTCSLMPEDSAVQTDISMQNMRDASQSMSLRDRFDSGGVHHATVQTTIDHTDVALECRPQVADAAEQCTPQDDAATTVLSYALRHALRRSVSKKNISVQTEESMESMHNMAQGTSFVDDFGPSNAVHATTQTSIEHSDAALECHLEVADASQQWNPIGSLTPDAIGVSHVAVQTSANQKDVALACHPEVVDASQQFNPPASDPPDGTSTCHVAAQTLAYQKNVALDCQLQDADVARQYKPHHESVVSDTQKSQMAQVVTTQVFANVGTQTAAEVSTQTASSMQSLRDASQGMSLSDRIECGSVANSAVQTLITRLNSPIHPNFASLPWPLGEDVSEQIKSDAGGEPCPHTPERTGKDKIYDKTPPTNDTFHTPITPRARTASLVESTPWSETQSSVASQASYQLPRFNPDAETEIDPRGQANCKNKCIVM